MEFYYVGLHQVDSVMRNQFGPPEERERQDRPATRRARSNVTARARLAVGQALYALASAIDPGTPAPSRQH